MFERFTEKARRVIFFARYEASELGRETIQAEALLLGLLRECGELLPALHILPIDLEELRAHARTRSSGQSIFPSRDMPLTDEAQRALRRAVEEADRLSARYVSEEHLLLGLLAERGSFTSDLLARHGADATVIRRALAAHPQQEVTNGIGSGSGRMQIRHVASDPGAMSPRYFGKYRGVVLDNADPERLGRIRAEVLAVAADLTWANPCTSFPKGEATLSVPPPGTSVWIEFERGDPGLPIWSGCFWKQGEEPLLKLPA